MDKLEEITRRAVEGGFDFYKKEEYRNMVGRNKSTYDELFVKALTHSLCLFWDNYAENHEQIWRELNEYPRVIN